MKRKPLAVLAGLVATTALVCGCAASGDPATPQETSGTEPISVGFFGFAATNSFAQGTFTGVQEAAADLGATATFVDGNFDGQQQVQQINDAITTREYDVIIIQANDGLAVQDPLQKAIDSGITVVVEFTPVGPAFDTIEPQMNGAISIVDPPVTNGQNLAELATQACAEVSGTCEVAYLEGFRSLPLDNARTKTFTEALSGRAGIEVVASVEGGYTQDGGRAAFQDVVQAHPDVDVVVGSSQAIAGAALVAGPDSGIRFVANGGSATAVKAVRSGEWFGAIVLDNLAAGRKAVELGVAHARGEQVETAINEADLSPNGGIGTKAALDEVDYVSGYDE